MDWIQIYTLVFAVAFFLFQMVQIKEPSDAVATLLAWALQAPIFLRAGGVI